MSGCSNCYYQVRLFVHDLHHAGSPGSVASSCSRLALVVAVLLTRLDLDSKPRLIPHGRGTRQAVGQRDERQRDEGMVYFIPLFCLAEAWLVYQFGLW